MPSIRNCKELPITETTGILPWRDVIAAFYDHEWKGINMLRFLKKKETDFDKEVFECFRTTFGIFRERRFPSHEEGVFSSRIQHHALVLELWKSHCFSWLPSNFYLYRNFSLESSFSFGAENGHSACGFIFRFVNNENFYYFLVSNRGLFRFDVLFNGNPLKIIEWTASPHIRPDRVKIRVIAHDSHFSFFIDDEWVAEIEDEKLNRGKIGIAAQNYGEIEKATFRFHELALESRPVEVEKAFWRWVRYIPVDPASRLTLARTFMNMGNFSAAAVELKQSLKRERENEEALMLFALCAVNLKLHDQALHALETLLSINPDHQEAAVERANALYLSNEFLKARDFILSIIDRHHDSSTLWNLLGNCEYSLGNWEKARDDYREAAEREPGMPLFHLNRARMEEKCAEPALALASYLKAAAILFREEAYDDLSLIMPRITALDPDNPDVLGFEAKMLFHENRHQDAEPILEKLIRADTNDSTIYYLLAIILIERGAREEALPLLEKAVELEPHYVLYLRRLAESKRELGRDYHAELERAASLSPDDPWVNNLFGLYEAEQGNFEQALGHLEKAHLALPAEIDITINFSDVLFRQGKKTKSLELVEHERARTEDPRLTNHLGNLFAREKKYSEAVTAYEKALRKVPGNPLYMENCAAACIEAEMITRAEELLVKLTEQNPSVSVFNLLGNLSVIRTEYLRAEFCYKEALQHDPGSLDAKINLASLYTERSQYEKAKELVDELLHDAPDKQTVRALHARFRKKFELSLHCSQCGREWWVFRDLPTQEAVKIHGEPPPESPAGKCPTCGKIYCIACAEAHVRQKRFICADCGEYLKLSDNYLRFLVISCLETHQQKGMTFIPFGMNDPSEH